jgi:16S rRNA G1207 methylase RsmC
VDINNRALELVRTNAGQCGAGNVRAVRPEQVPAGIRFAAIYSNPPIKIGKEPLHELLRDWMARLTGEGDAHLVVHKHLGSDSLARWLGDRGFPVHRVRSKMGYRILTVGGQVHRTPA